ncbi:type IV secretion system DNA-binding domain-containing protein [Acinetobacter baumannii]
MSNNNENFFTKKHTKATHRGRYVLMVLYAFYAFASQGFFTAIISTAIVSAIIYFVIDAMWKSIAQNAKEQSKKEFLKEHVRGAEQWGKRGYENYLVATANGLTGDERKIYAHEVCNGHREENLSPIQDYLQFAGTFLPPEIEKLHIAIVASTGAGKSVALKKLIREIRKRGDRAIIIDNGYEFYDRFGAVNEYLLNPFDKRSLKWDISNEIKQDFEWTKFAKSIIPDGHGSEKEWNRMAQALISNIGINTGADNKTLLEIATSYSIKQLEPILQGTSSAVLLQEGGERLLTNIRSVFATYLQAWQFAESGDFSIRDYVLGNDQKWLWIPFKDNELEVSKNLIATWLDIAVNAGLEREEGQNPKTWIILDELDTLGELSSLISATTKLRKRNMPIVTAFQSYSQLAETYGENRTETLLNCFSTKLIMRTSSAKLAETMSLELGEREVWQSGQKTGVDRKGDEEHKKTERLVLASELSNLDPLNGYLRLAGDYPVVKVKFEYE